MAIGVVTGLKAEAACIGAAADHIVVMCLGPGPERAARAATALIKKEKVKGLISFGVAGGLAPYLEAGDLVLGTAVRSPDDTTIPTDRVWTARLNHAIARVGLRPHAGRLLGADAPVLTPAEKQKLFEHSGALCVDMESHAVARTAAKHDVPFVAVRTVADPAGLAIPAIALAGLRPDGSIVPFRVALRLVAEPWRFPALLKLSAGHNAALKTLRSVAAALNEAAAPARA